MTTIHLGVEELIARQQSEFVEHSVRHSWHLSEFRRRPRGPAYHKQQSGKTSWPGELVDLSITQLRWAMI